MLYKWKTDKIWLMNWFDSDEKVSKNSNKWWKKIIMRKNMIKVKLIWHEFNVLITLKFLNIERKSCLMFKWIEKLITDNLWLKEKKLFLWMLYNWETVLTFDYSEMNCLKEKVQSLMKIKMIEHILWQTSSFFILKALILKVTVMLKKQKVNDLLKKCDELY